MTDERKTRVLIFSAVVPSTSGGGGRLALHRHFVQRNDYTTTVVSLYAGDSTTDSQMEIRKSGAFKRIRTSFLARLMYNTAYLFAPYMLPRKIRQFAIEWKPDVIFTVADDWHAQMAFRLSRILSVPIILNFQDLFAASRFTVKGRKPYGWVKRILFRRYRELEKKADVALFTCPGMGVWFNCFDEDNILYPIGEETEIREATLDPRNDPITLVYAGNCYGPYGVMLKRLADKVLESGSISLEIYAMGNDWSEEDVARYRDRGIYKGYLPYDRLREKLEKADAFLTAMSFEESDRTFVSTSFTTKWLDYAPLAQPIFVWAPKYSSAVHFAGKHGAGVCICDDDCDKVIATVRSLMDDKARWHQYGAGAQKVARGILNSERIHARLREKIDSLTGLTQAGKSKIKR